MASEVCPSSLRPSSKRNRQTLQQEKDVEKSNNSQLKTCALCNVQYTHQKTWEHSKSDPHVTCKKMIDDEVYMQSGMPWWQLWDLEALLDIKTQCENITSSEDEAIDQPRSSVLSWRNINQGNVGETSQGNVGETSQKKRTKVFNCKQCPYKSAYKQMLIEHERTHTGEKPYACTYCKYKCARQKDRRIHERMHTGETPYACTLCTFKCVSSSKLKRHLNVHVKERPYKCKSCPKKSYKTRAYLIVHVKNNKCKGL